MKVDKKIEIEKSTKNRITSSLAGKNAKNNSNLTDYDRIKK